MLPISAGRFSNKLPYFWHRPKNSSVIFQDKVTPEPVCQKYFGVFFFNLKTSSAADRNFQTDRRSA